MLKCKKVISCALATMIAMQGGGLVFANENTNVNHYYASQKENNQKDILNYMIENGYLAVDSNNNLFATTKYINYVENQVRATNKNAVVTVDGATITIRDAAKNNSGETKFEWTWKGFDIYIEHDLCVSLVNSGVTSAAVLEVLARTVPPAAPLADIVAAIVATGSAIFTQQDLGRGIIIAFVYPCVPHWISSQ